MVACDPAKRTDVSLAGAPVGTEGINSVSLHLHICLDEVQQVFIKNISKKTEKNIYRTISTLVEHSIWRSFHIASSQSKSKKSTTTAGILSRCLVIQHDLSMPLGMYHSYEGRCIAQTKWY